jgi:hypothetical protein
MKLSVNPAVETRNRAIRRAYWIDRWPRQRILSTFKVTGAYVSAVVGGDRRRKV